MNTFTQIQQYIKKNNLIKSGQKIVVGLSGGPDSVFLLHFLASLQKEYNLTLIAAHLNHEWRTKAGQEQTDCATLAQKLNIPALMFHDKSDNVTPVEDSRAIAKTWKHVQYVETDGLGHRGALQSPEVHEQVIKFLKS